MTWHINSPVVTDLKVSNVNQVHGIYFIYAPPNAKDL